MLLYFFLFSFAEPRRTGSIVLLTLGTYTSSPGATMKRAVFRLEQQQQQKSGGGGADLCMRRASDP